MTSPFRLDHSVLHLDGVGPITLASNEPRFWEERDRSEFRCGQILSVFNYSTTWDYQERHSDGDELALVLDGDIDFLIDSGGGEAAVRLGRGFACVVPAGAWHRVAVHEPSAILFITPVPSRTEHRGVDIADPETALRRGDMG